MSGADFHDAQILCAVGLTDVYCYEAVVALAGSHVVMLLGIISPWTRRDSGGPPLRSHLFSDCFHPLVIDLF